MAFERVYTIWDYYDGPRSGIANVNGQPHYYDCEWSDEQDDFANTFLVVPVDEEKLAIALKDWESWRKWEFAFHRGELDLSTHPVNVTGVPSHASFEAEFRSKIDVLRANSVRLHAQFRALPGQDELPQGVMRALEVEWTSCA